MPSANLVGDSTYTPAENAEYELSPHPGAQYVVNPTKVYPDEKERCITYHTFSSRLWYFRRCGDHHWLDILFHADHDWYTRETPEHWSISLDNWERRSVSVPTCMDPFREEQLLRTHSWLPSKEYCSNIAFSCCNELFIRQMREMLQAT